MVNDFAVARRRRPVRAAFALVLALWIQACTTYVPARAGAALRPAYNVRVQRSAPTLLSAPSGSDTAIPLCRVTFVEGRLSRSVGDTLVFDRVNRVIAVPADGAPTARCPRFGATTTLIRTEDTEVAVRRLNGGRTTVLVLSLAAILVAFAAFAASQIETGFPPDGGGLFRPASAR